MSKIFREKIDGYVEKCGIDFILWSVMCAKRKAAHRAAFLVHV